MKRIKAAAVQIAPDLTTRTGTVDRVCDAIDRAASQGVELAVFPETFIPYYPYFSFVAPAVQMGKDHLRLYEWAVEVPGPVTERLSKAAAQHGMVLVVGVNERDGGSLYNTQLIFENDGRLLLKRRKITPTYHERMVWGQGDGAGIRAVETAVGRVGALACWEHYNPLARFALMEEREEIHCAQFPGSMVGQIFRRSNRGHDQASCAGIRLLCRECHRLADRRADQLHHAGRQAPQGAARRVSHRDHLAGRSAVVHDDHRRRRHGHRGAGSCADHQAQKDDGFGGSLLAARHLHAAHQPRRQPAGAEQERRFVRSTLCWTSH